MLALTFDFMLVFDRSLRVIHGEEVVVDTKSVDEGEKSEDGMTTVRMRMAWKNKVFIPSACVSVEIVNTSERASETVS